MLTASELRGLVDSAVQEITEGQAAFKEAAEKIAELLARGNEHYDAAATTLFQISEKTFEAAGMLRNAVDNQSTPLSAQVKDSMDRVINTGVAAQELAEAYAGQI